MTKKANNKKSSASRKLIPAIGMLTVSAMMLSSATYAWFTMAREVSVENIQMTATVPEDLQISLGAVTDGTLQASTGTLTRANGVTTAPNNTGTATDNPDWNNTADISKYYIFGNLIPASSTTGAALYFTPDSTGDGSTVSASAARYYNALATGGMATLHAKTSTDKTNANNDKWTGYSPQTGYLVSDTHDDGYYIDIPVWFRTSASSDVTLSVQAFAKRDADAGATAVDKVTDGDLYKAVRVAIISGGSTNMIAVADGSFGGTTVYDWGNLGDAGAKAVASITGDGEQGATYDTPTVYNSGSTTVGSGTVVTVAAPVADAQTNAKANYGAVTAATIRIWLEGEDSECINPNAAQDWDISLKFSKTAANGG